MERAKQKIKKISNLDIRAFSMAKSKLRTVGKELRVIEGNINRLIDWYCLIDYRWFGILFLFRGCSSCYVVQVAQNNRRSQFFVDFVFPSFFPLFFLFFFFRLIVTQNRSSNWQLYQLPIL